MFTRLWQGLALVSVIVVLISGCGHSGGTTALAPEAATTRTRDADGMEMVYVPGGTFRMGHGVTPKERAHGVTLDGFWIDRTEVSNAHYRHCVEAGACRAPTTCNWGEPTYEDAAKAQHPVVCVSWREAQAYCAWAGGRLPTEAEWEYTARGPDATVYPWGDTFDGTRLNSCDAICDHEGQQVHDYNDGYARTSPVGTYPDGASWCGALDMGGNVWEWVADWYAPYPIGRQMNPTGPAEGQERIMRGGSWFDYNAYGFLRMYNRHPFDPQGDNDTLGFRCMVPGG